MATPRWHQELWSLGSTLTIAMGKINTIATTKKYSNLPDWHPLAVKKSKIQLNMLYKINHNLINIPIDDLKPNPRELFNYLLPQLSVDSHLHSFFPNTVRPWNSIPYHCKSCVSLGTFKSSLDKLTFNRNKNLCHKLIILLFFWSISFYTP